MNALLALGREKKQGQKEREDGNGFEEEKQEERGREKERGDGGWSFAGNGGEQKVTEKRSVTEAW